MEIMSQRYLKTQCDMSILVLNYQCIICKKGSSHNSNNNICVVNLVEADLEFNLLIQGIFSWGCSKGLS